MADNLTIQIGADTSKLRADLALAQAEVRKLGREMSTMARDASRTGDRSALDPDPTNGTHWRVSPALTWYPTEFSKFRLQVNHDRIQGMGNDLSVWLQMEFILGAHAAHKF